MSDDAKVLLRAKLSQQLQLKVLQRSYHRPRSQVAALLSAANSGNTAAVKQLLDEGVPVDARGPVGQPPSDLC